MKNFNLLNIVTTVILIAICSAASAEPRENASSLEAPVSDTATSIVEAEPASSNITEPETNEITEEAATPPVAIVVEPISDIEYTCEHNTSKRIIRVFNDTAAGLACEVTYEKDTGSQTLWTARNDQEYCAQKAAEFAAKQADWGWLCFNQDGEIIPAPLEEPAEEASIIETSTEEIPAIEASISETPTEEIPAIEVEPATTEAPVETEATETEASSTEVPVNE